MRPIIVLDPGHGGSSTAGGSSPNRASAANGLQEKDVVLDIARRLDPMLAPVAEVRLTRETDVNLSLSARARAARDSEAALFLSLHLNGSQDSSVDGTQAWIARSASTRSRALAETLLMHIAAATSIPNRGVRERDLGVLLPARHSPQTGACLLEIGYLTNPEQARRLREGDYRQRLAVAIADSLRAHLQAPSSAQEWVEPLGPPTAPSDTPANFPNAIRAYWAAPSSRLFHYYWHRARQDWSALSASERRDITTFGFTAPPRAAGASGAGLDFLFMHRQMMAATRAVARARRLRYRPRGWNPIPWNHNDPAWPMPAVSGGASPAKDQTVTDYWREMVRSKYADRRQLQRLTLDTLGAEIEEGIHNWMHMHWATDPPARRDDTSTANDWLGDPFSAAANPTFWKLHGWIDELMGRWERAQTAGRTGRSVAAALRGFTPWVGPRLATPTATTHAVASPSREPAPHHPPISAEDAIARIARIDFTRWDPFPFARFTLSQLRERFGSESTPALVAGLQVTNADPIVRELDRIQGTSIATYDNYVRTYIVPATVFGRPVRGGVHRDFLPKLQQAEQRANSGSGGATSWDVTSIGGHDPRDGWHGWGLAIDMNYAACPYIMHEEGEGDLDRELAPVYHRISQLMTRRESAIPREITRGARSVQRTRDLYDRLHDEDVAMREYFQFLTVSREAVERSLRAMASADPPHDWRSIFGTDGSPTADQFLDQVMRDYVALTGRSGPPVSGRTYPQPSRIARTNTRRRPGQPVDRPFQGDPNARDPRRGFLNVERQIVLALSEVGLRWGAIDFGGQSGDVMHFDDGLSASAANIARASQAAQRDAARAHELTAGLEAPVALCASDVPVTETMALLVSQKAPLPVTPAIAQAINASARDDYKSVCAIVPRSPDQRLLIYFHGNNNYVTVAPHGDVPPRIDPSGYSRVPRWADARARRGAQGKRAAALSYSLGALEASQRALSLPESAAVKRPVVLLPEDVELSTGGAWSVPPRGQYTSTTRLEELVMDCYEHLRCLVNPSGQHYLEPGMEHGASYLGNVRRVYLSGHSGGGKPLVEAAGSDMMLVTSTSAMGVGDRAADLWLFDCTYGFGIQNYIDFCRNWQAAGKLAYRADSSRLVCVYLPKSPNSDTETEADSLRVRLAREVLQVPADSLRKLHDSNDMSSRSMTSLVIPALMNSAVVFIRTQVPHDQIPTKFIPLLLRTAAS